jgi:uncharacterized membrane protein YgcG
MKRLCFGLVVAVLISLAQVGFVSASVNDFTIESFTADYYLDKDSSGHSTLKTVEAITAEFPSIDQNHGIERAIPTSYDGHDVNLDIISVTDQNGVALNYSEYTSNDNLVIRIGDSDTYVHGLNVYVISYTQRDVTKFFADTNSDEFYWDVNGTGWSQPFKYVAAKLHIGSGIKNSLTGKQSCYFGVSSSTDQCDISGQDNVITAETVDVGPGGNMTIAVGFQPKTFAAYTETLKDLVKRYSSVITMAISLVVLIIIVSLRLTKGRGAPRTTAIVAEYLPPKGADIALSSVIVGKPRVWVAATYVDMAVRHKIKIYELEKKGWGRTNYSLELVSADGLTESETDIMKALFGSNLVIGSKYEIQTNTSDLALYRMLESAYAKVKKYAESENFVFNKRKLLYVMVGLIVLSVAQGWIISALFINQTTVLAGLSFFVCAFLAIAGAIVVSTTKPLTLKGRELHTYLKGLELYIKIGEQDRLKVLQSPSGAEKTPVDINNKSMLVKLYERVLPYAVLFGQEKGWTKALGVYYEQQNMQPDWYVGSTAFNVVMFSSALSSFSSSATNSSYTSPSSSSSGGSGGGGFSGGGGGGGGGGGW